VESSTSPGRVPYYRLSVNVCHINCTSSIINKITINIKYKPTIKIHIYPLSITSNIAPRYKPTAMLLGIANQRQRGGGPNHRLESMHDLNRDLLQEMRMNIEYNISSNGALLIVPITPPINSWTPNEFRPIPRSNRHPFQQLVQSLSLTSIRNITRRNPTDTIVKSSSKPDMHITTRDFRDLLSYGVPIYHELLVLSLETLCKNFDSTYLDPSFYPTLRDHGCTSIIHWFRPAGRSSITRPSIDHHNIAIP
jgi:hypothetical protein